MKKFHLAIAALKTKHKEQVDFVSSFENFSNGAEVVSWDDNKSTLL